MMGIEAKFRKIRVCHLASGDLWAGAEVQISTLLASLIEMPHLEISVVLFNRGRLASELRSLGIETHVIDESRHHPLSMLKQLADYFQQNKVDILHTHKYKDNILGGLSSFYAKVPWRVRTIHGLPEPYVGLQSAKRKIYQIVDEGVNRWLVDRMLTVSFDLRNRFIKHYGVETVGCIHNAVNVEEIGVSRCATDLRKQLEIGEQDFVIGTMCRLTPVKGLELFLMAARIIRNERPNVKFIIGGDGPLRTSLEALACDYGLGGDVLFLGHRNDSHDVLKLMDLFVLPSLNEGIPMALLEALALARPVVATRVGGIPEVIEHGINGLLVAAGREDELAKSCIALLDNHGWAQSIGLAGRSRVIDNFSPGLMAEKVAEVYRALVLEGERRGQYGSHVHGKPGVPQSLYPKSR